MKRCYRVLNVIACDTKNSSTMLRCIPSVRKSLFCARHLHSSTWKIQEIEIPLAYGKLAAKAWGNESAQPVLALHGWQDNAGTFDRLIPLLSDKFFYVALDAPGHGLSSHKPPGCLYTDLDFVADFKRATDFLGWKKFHILAHSLGGAMASVFSVLFADSVEKLILLDITKPLPWTFDKPPLEVAQNGFKDYLKQEKKLGQPPPVYTEEQIVKRLIAGLFNEITEDGARILMKRGIKKSDCGNGFVFSGDVRFSYVKRDSQILVFRDKEMLKAIVLGLKCEMLIILANQRHPYYTIDSSEDMTEFTEVYEKNCKRFVLERVDGNHFVHLNNPEVIAPIVNKFMLS